MLINGNETIFQRGDDRHDVPKETKILRLEDGITQEDLKYVHFAGLSLEKLIVPGSVKDLPKLFDCAFSRSFFGEKPFTVEELILEEGVERIGYLALMEAQVKKVSLPKSLFYIVEGGFENSAIEEISIPDGVEVDFAAFSFCSKLRKVVFEGSMESYGKRTIYGNVFKGCTSLEEVHVQEPLDAIYRDAFENCKSLKGIFLPDGSSAITPETDISDSAFRGCPLEAQIARA